VVPIDQVELAAVHQGMRNLLLLCVRFTGVLLTGMHRAQDDVHPELPGLHGLGDHGRGVQHVHLPGVVRDQSVEPVSGLDDCHFRGGRLHDEDSLGLAFRPVGACVFQAGSIQGIKGAQQSVRATVDGVVAAGGACLVAHIPGRGDDLRRNVE
jgi:hypothetical protein